MVSARFLQSIAVSISSHGGPGVACYVCERKHGVKLFQAGDGEMFAQQWRTYLLGARKASQTYGAHDCSVVMADDLSRNINWVDASAGSGEVTDETGGRLQVRFFTSDDMEHK